MARQHAASASRRPTSAVAEVALLRGNLARAIDLFNRAGDLAEQVGDRPQVVWDRGSVALAAAYGGDHSTAFRYAEAATAAAIAAGSPSAIGFAHYIHGEVVAPIDRQAARTHFEEAIAAADGVSARYVVNLAQLSIASLTSLTDDLDTALERYASVIAQWRRAQSWTAEWLTLRGLVCLLADTGHAPEQVAVLHGAVGAAEQGPALYGADAVRMQNAAQKLRWALGSDAFAAAAERGTTLEPPAVLDLALALCRSPDKSADSPMPS